MTWLRRHADAIIVLVIILGLYGANTVRTGHVQAAQQRQGRVLEHRLCLTLGRLAALQPPAGNPATNPSRGFDQAQHAILAQLGPDVGCPP